MEEFFKPGTDFDPRVSYKSDTDTLLFGAKSDCRDPGEFYGEYSILVCKDVADRPDSDLHIVFTLDFISSGSLTSIEHFLKNTSDAIGAAHWSRKLSVSFSRYDDPTIEDAVLHLKTLSDDWDNLEFSDVDWAGEA